MWRKKAYEVFGFKPGSYSFSNGKDALFDDLREMAKMAIGAQDSAQLDRIFEYVIWADEKNAENLRSALDISFFIPLFSDEDLLSEASKRLPCDILTAKRALATETD